ncbi:uncharacterized protein LOC116956433 isoform X3 [Petromyzon marinus]|uniref:uncharacterized protein LOC116956433 isoform X3 n=1 Tax=Petromyzon marinus TaxID=7757 RepID=UPI003F706C46
MAGHSMLALLWLSQFYVFALVGEASVMDDLYTTIQPSTGIYDDFDHGDGTTICSVWGTSHLLTFDHASMDLPLSSCALNLVSITDSPSLSLSFQRSALDRMSVENVVVTMEGISLSLTREGQSISGQRVQLPYKDHSIQIEMVGSYIKCSSIMGFSLLWDQNNAITVKLDPKFNTKTTGLCGDFNGIADDFYLNGVLRSESDYTLMNKLNSLEMCSQEPQETNSYLSSEYCLNKTQHIEHLFEDELLSCVSVMDHQLKSLLVNILWSDICRLDCNGTAGLYPCDGCATIAEFSRRCTQANESPGTWRSPEFCGVTCPRGQVHRECGSVCKDTCSNPSASVNCPSTCVDGCFCPEGTVWDDVSGSGCIPQSNCGCNQLGQSYASGESLITGCKNCTCEQGQWNCDSRPCYGTCKILGGSYFSTFDSKTYRFHGDCFYTLTTDCAGNKFSVLGELTKCEGRDSKTCLNSVIFYIDGIRTVVFKASGDVLVHENKVPLPFVSASVTIVQESSFYLRAETNFGLRLRVQLKPLMQLYITAATAYHNKTCGLCGNFNEVTGDDFTHSGIVDATAATFCNVWKAQATCPDREEVTMDPCSVYITNNEYAKAHCGLLMDNDGPFSTCHSVVSADEYYTRCKYDTCSCSYPEPCLCAALSAYAYACSAHGVVLVGWRSDICSLDAENCPVSHEFSYAAPECGSASCRTSREVCRAVRPPPFELPSPSPVEGCVCGAGLYDDEHGVCVLKSDCPCYSEMSGDLIRAGVTVDLHDTQCLCTGGELHCFGLSPISGNTCEGLMTYHNCSDGSSEGSAACQRTCANPHSICYSPGCVSGCVCPGGLIVDHNGNCVSEEQCTCEHNGRHYDPGDTITQLCNKCTCMNARWSCTSEVCQGLCFVYGEGHHTTFDGKQYVFDGSCQYILSQDSCGNSSGSFRITTENEPCGTTGTTCSKKVHFYAGADELVLTDGTVKGSSLDFPGSPFHVRRMGIYTVVETSLGVTIIWDGHTAVSVHVNPQLKGRVCGLCGDYDGKVANDFVTRTGSVAASAPEFAAGWKESGSGCPDLSRVSDPCTINHHRESWAHKQCSVLKDGVFKQCHNMVEYLPYYAACVRDSCGCDTGGDCHCLCTALASYAQACGSAGVCLRWRTPDLCPLGCDLYNKDEGQCEWHYRECGRGCQRSCTNRNAICTANLPPLEGCYPTCPSDRPFLNESSMTCVERCDCVSNGTTYKVNDRIPSNDPCEICSCTIDDISCTIIPGCPQSTTIITPTTTESTTTTSSSTAPPTTISTTSESTTRPPSTSASTLTTESTTTPPPTTAPPSTTSITESTTTPPPTTAPPSTTSIITESTTTPPPTTAPPSTTSITTESTTTPPPTTAPPSTTSITTESTTTPPPTTALPSTTSITESTTTPPPTTAPPSTTSITTESTTTPPPTTAPPSTTSITESTTTPPPTTAPPSTTSIITESTTTPPPTTAPPSTTSITESTTTPPPTTPPPSATSITTESTTMPPSTTHGCIWTSWKSIDYPNDNNPSNDNETYAHYQEKTGHAICEIGVPILIDCRARGYEKANFADTGNGVTCDVKEGLLCLEELQDWSGQCKDYEIRVCCPGEGNTSTITTPTAIPSTTAPPSSTSITTESTTTPPPTTAPPSTTSITTESTTTPPPTTAPPSTNSITESTTTPPPTTAPPSTTSILTESTATPPPTTAPPSTTSITESTTTPPSTTAPPSTTSTITESTTTPPPTTAPPSTTSITESTTTPPPTTAPPSTTSITTESTTTPPPTTAPPSTTSITTESTTPPPTTAPPSTNSITESTTTPPSTTAPPSTTSITTESTTTPPPTTAPPSTTSITESTTTPPPTTAPPSTTSIITESTTTPPPTTAPPSTTSITESTTTPPPTTPPPSTTSITTESTTMPPSTTRGCIWTSWKSIDYPNDNNPSNDNETYAHYQEKTGHAICEIGVPILIDCRARGYEKANFADTGNGVMCDVKEGLLCLEELQDWSGQCKDYEIRVCCPGEGNTSTITTPTAIPSTTAPPSSTSITTESTTTPPPTTAPPSTTSITTESTTTPPPTTAPPSTNSITESTTTPPPTTAPPSTTSILTESTATPPPTTAPPSTTSITESTTTPPSTTAPPSTTSTITESTTTPPPTTAPPSTTSITESTTTPPPTTAPPSTTSITTESTTTPPPTTAPPSTTSITTESATPPPTTAPPSTNSITESTTTPPSTTALPSTTSITTESTTTPPPTTAPPSTTSITTESTTTPPPTTAPPSTTSITTESTTTPPPTTAPPSTTSILTESTATPPPTTAPPSTTSIITESTTTPPLTTAPPSTTSITTESTTTPPPTTAPPSTNSITESTTTPPPTTAPPSTTESTTTPPPTTAPPSTTSITTESTTTPPPTTAPPSTTSLTTESTATPPPTTAPPSTTSITTESTTTPSSTTAPPSTTSILTESTTTPPSTTAPPSTTSIITESTTIPPPTTAPPSTNSITESTTTPPPTTAPPSTTSITTESTATPPPTTAPPSSTSIITESTTTPPPTTAPPSTTSITTESTATPPTTTAPPSSTSIITESTTTPPPTTAPPSTTSITTESTTTPPPTTAPASTTSITTESTATPPPTTAPPSTTITTESTTTTCVWSEWFNSDIPNLRNEGDNETLAHIRESGLDICPMGYPVKITCQVVGTPHLTFPYFVQNVTCDVSTGLLCLNKDNAPLCKDYQIRVCCYPIITTPFTMSSTTIQSTESPSTTVTFQPSSKSSATTSITYKPTTETTTVTLPTTTVTSISTKKPTKSSSTTPSKSTINTSTQTPTCLPCKTPVKPVCENKALPQLVKKGCCEEYECPCFCKGWGDPHFLTFGSNKYDFQGVCQYVLVQQINGFGIDWNFHFKVLIDTYGCGARDGVSCPQNLIISYEQYEIRLERTDNTTNVKVLLNGITTQTPYKIPGNFSIDYTGITLTVNFEKINSRITFDGQLFFIVLSHKIFGNKTEGQCGKCSNVPSNDCRLPSGVPVSCAVMAGAWNTTTCRYPVPTTETPITTTPCPSQPCDILKSSLFADCNKMLSPDIYYDSCVFDKCAQKTKNAACASIKAYSKECEKLGFCIPWRENTNGICNITCPEGKVYHQCSTTFDKSCNLKDIPDINISNRTYEGCFCPEGEFLFTSTDPSMNESFCVSDCGCAGPNGERKKLNEVWDSGCNVCECNAGTRSVVCKPRACPLLGHNNCNESGWAIRNPNDACCPECMRVCLYNGIRYPVSTQVPSMDCSTCECTNEIDDATKFNKITCEKIICNQTCQTGYEYVDQQGACCECRKTNCTFNMSGRVILIQPGETVQDPQNNCTTLHCESTIGGPNERTQIVQCQYKFPEDCPPGYEYIHREGECCGECVKTKCVFNMSGIVTVLEPGRTAQDPRNSCLTLHCDSSIGGPIERTQTVQCQYNNPKDCQPGYEYHRERECCGECVKTKCVFNMSGIVTVLKPGETVQDPQNNCTTLHCESTIGGLSEKTQTVECSPNFNPDDCLPGTIKLDEANCCKTCERPQGNCRRFNSSKYIFYGACRSVEPVEVVSCEGACPTYSMYSEQANDINHTCKCCRDVKTRPRSTSFLCSNGTRIDTAYTFIEECGCKAFACNRSTRSIADDLTLVGDVGLDYSHRNRLVRKRALRVQANP